MPTERMMWPEMKSSQNCRRQYFSIREAEGLHNRQSKYPVTGRCPMSFISTVWKFVSTSFSVKAKFPVPSFSAIQTWVPRLKNTTSSNVSLFKSPLTAPMAENGSANASGLKLPAPSPSRIRSLVTISAFPSLLKSPMPTAFPPGNKSYGSWVVPSAFRI